MSTYEYAMYAKEARKQKVETMPYSQWLASRSAAVPSASSAPATPAAEPAAEDVKPAEPVKPTGKKVIVSRHVASGQPITITLTSSKSTKTLSGEKAAAFEQKLSRSEARQLAMGETLELDSSRLS